MADGREVRVSINIDHFEFTGEVMGATIVMRKEGTEPSLGVTVVEIVGIEVYLRIQKLRRMPFVR